MSNGRKSEYYNVLSEVAKESDFDPDQLARMFVVESSGDPEAVNPLGYTGGFQFGKSAGEEYGLVGEDFDYRKDLGKSAKAAINMYKKNLKDEVLTASGKTWSMGDVYGGLGIEEDLAGYLAHQQGRSGLIDIITGAKSGKVGTETRKNMLANLGDQDLSDLSDKELTNKFVDFWKDRWQTKRSEADKWITEAKSPIASLEAGGKIEDKLIANMLKQERGIFG